MRLLLFCSLCLLLSISPVSGVTGRKVSSRTVPSSQSIRQRKLQRREATTQWIGRRHPHGMTWGEVIGTQLLSLSLFLICLLFLSCLLSSIFDHSPLLTLSSLISHFSLLSLPPVSSLSSITSSLPSLRSALSPSLFRTQSIVLTGMQRPTAPLRTNSSATTPPFST